MLDAELHVISEAGHVPMLDEFDEFMAVLAYSLENTPRGRQAQFRFKLVEEDAVKKDIRCDGQKNIVYTGACKGIQIDNCHGIVLRDLVADHIEVTGSEISLENVKLSTAGTGLSIRNSAVFATLLQVDAKVGMIVNSSFLDLAGADFF